MHDPSYQRAVQRITAAVEEKANITGAVRLCWEDLEPLIVSRYVTVAKLSRDTGANFTALYRAVRRVRWERGQQSSEHSLGQASDGRKHVSHHSTERASSKRDSTHKPSGRPQPDQSAQPETEEDPQTDPAASGSLKRIGNLVINKDAPKHQPKTVTDEHGFITLENGIRYRPDPETGHFFEVYKPGKSKPHTTDRRPLPDDEV